MDKIVIIGLGQFGRTLAESLTQEGAEVLAIDKNEKIVEEFKDKVASVVALDATDEEALNSQGVKEFDVCIVAIGERHFLAAVLATALLKKIGVPKIIARGVRTESRIEEKILELVGADRIVLPSVETATRLTQEVLSTDILNYISVSQGYSMIKITAPKEFVGKTIKTLALRDTKKVNLIGLQKLNAEINYLPRSSDKIEEGDTLFLVGKEEDVAKII